MNILITGGAGYIASTLKRHLSDEYTITSITKNDFDLTDREETARWFSDKFFDVVIHTAITGGSRLILDDIRVLDNNLNMYYNLVAQRAHYSKFISIGSGAELYHIDTPYGLSKHVIRQSMLKKDNFYNIRVFAVFDENELSTRFIKGNLLRYINKEPLSIHCNKKMDFFYMKDFVSVMKYYIESQQLLPEFNCTYPVSVDLNTIASYINQLSDYRVGVQYSTDSSQPDYIGEYTPIDIKFLGLQTGITEVYHHLLSNNTSTQVESSMRN